MFESTYGTYATRSSSTENNINNLMIWEIVMIMLSKNNVPLPAGKTRVEFKNVIRRWYQSFRPEQKSRRKWSLMIMALTVIKLSSFAENSCGRVRHRLYMSRDYKRSRSLSVYMLWLNYRRLFPFPIALEKNWFIQNL